MKWIVYNLLFAAVYPFLLPGFLLRMLRRGGYANRFWDRFALYPEGLFGKSRPLFESHALPTAGCRLPTANFIWIHAVSVGEVQVAGQLMREWRKVDPSVRFCFSTTSSTGWKMAEREVKAGGEGEGGGDVLIYNPLDFPNFVKSALKTVRPRAIVLTESEIWPNFIRQAKKMGMPLFLVNARVSDRSAPRYRFARFFFKDVLASFTRIFAQSDLDKARLVAAGAPADKVEVTGSFKFDVARRNEAKESELREWLLGSLKDGIGSDRVEIGPSGVGSDAIDSNSTLNVPKILLGGSTWPGEDEVLLRIYKKLLNSTVPPPTSCLPPDSPTSCLQPLLVIAPRHFEKADAVEANIRKAGFACVRRSRSDVPSPTSHLPPVFLADTTGELMGLYGIADVVFVGKSLCAHGSQNMIEPCLCGKPTFVGPYTENFRPVMSDLLAADAIVQVKDEAELEERIVEVFCASGEDVASPLGERARVAVERRRGVVAKCLASVRSAL